MSIWRHSAMFVYEKERYYEVPCEVTIHGDRITVSSYDVTEQRPSVYTGIENSPGHFQLEDPEVRGTASLHRFEGSDLLDGFWAEAPAVGMWRIQLIDDDG